MRLTIVKMDGTVCKDKICLNNLIWEGTPANVHALQWYETVGNIEFNNGDPNQEITELPDWANNAVIAWDAGYIPPTPPLPTPPKQINYDKATGFLYQTDWTTIPDVVNPSLAKPYLGNPQDFIEFRNIVRNVAINPPDTLFNFPTVPTPQWIYE
jgi:hypothetical protein